MVRTPLRSARAAVLAYFIIVGLTESIWIARIPGVKERLHLADGLLGTVVSEPVLSGTEPGRSAGSRSR